MMFILFFVLGSLIFVALLLLSDHRKEIEFDFLEFFTFSTVFGLLSLGLLGLFLAEIGHFNFKNIFALFLLLASISIFLVLQNKRKGWGLVKIKFLPKEELLLLIWAAVFLLVIIRKPFEWIYWGRDPAFYVNTGVRIAKTDTLFMKEKRVELATDPVKRKFFFYGGRSPKVLRLPLYFYCSLEDFGCSGKKLGGLYIGKGGLIKPQFFHLYSTLFALSFLFTNSLLVSLFVTPFLMLLSLLVGFYWLRRIFNYKRTNKETIFAVIFLILSSINFAIVWYSKYPNAEVVSLLLVLTGFYFLTLSEKHAKGLLAVVGGSFLGLNFFNKIDFFLSLPLLPIFLLLSRYLEKKIEFRFFLSALAVGLVGFFHSLIVSTPYVVDNIGPALKHLFPINENILLWLIAFLLFSIYIWLLVFKNQRICFWFNKNVLTPITKNILNSNFLLVILILFFSFLFYRTNGAEIRSDSYNLIKILWYVGFPVLFGGLLEIYFQIKETKSRGSLLPESFIYLWLFYFLFYLYRARIYPDHPWWARRFVFLIIPGLILFFTLFLKRVWHKKNRFLFIVLLPLTLVIYLRMSFPLWKFVEYEGAIKAIGEIASIVEEEKVPIFLSGNEVFRNRVGGPLLNIYGKDIIPLLGRKKYGLSAIYNHWTLMSQEIANNGYVLFIGESIPFWGLNFSYEKIHSGKIPIVEWPRTEDRLSLKPNELIEVSYGIWKIGFAGEGEKSVLFPSEIYGLSEFGFYQPEKDEEKGTEFIWSSEHFLIPFLGKREGSLKIKLVLFPQAQQKIDSVVGQLNECLVDPIIGKEGGEEFLLMVFDKKCLIEDGPQRFEAKSDTFQPEGGDERLLGICIKRIEIN